MTGRVEARDAPVVIFSERPGWHSEQMHRALHRHGFTAVNASLSACRLETHPTPRVFIPGLEGLPAAALVRSIPAGTLQEVVFRLNILHVLDAEGVLVCNDGRAVERSVDKGLTTHLLARAGVTSPPTRVTACPEQARAWIERERQGGHATVLKPLFGSQGRDLLYLEAPGELPPPEAYDGVYYLQRYVRPAREGWHDWRVLVVGDRAVAAMRRSSEGWISNIARGGQASAAVPDGPLAEKAVAAARALDMAYAGVDLIAGEDGVLQVLEVNSIPAWRALQEASRVDVAQALVDDLVRRLDPAGQQAGSA